jgi:2-polyprenyl-6-methoxyphenol hydroxylase-like FAD-dependent oxidoreductase
MRDPRQAGDVTGSGSGGEAQAASDRAGGQAQMGLEMGRGAGRHTGRPEYDAAIVGASIAGCTAAIMLARRGARVALIEQRPDVAAYKRVCSHYIQSSAVATLERAGLLGPMLEAGAVRSRGRIWTRWGWIVGPRDSSVPSGVNLRRSALDPLLRTMAAETPGVEMMLGRTAEELLSGEGERIAGAVRGTPAGGIEVRDRAGGRERVRARLVVGADGRGSRVARLAGVKRRTAPHGRFAYGGYFEGPAPAGAPDASIWFLDPDMAAAFPTDGGLTFYACMPIKERLPEFRRDPEAALRAFVAAIPDAPPIEESRVVAPVEGKPIQGKIDMTNVAHAPIAPGLALVGDAALAADPLWGVGCGWAFQSAEWLADSVAPALCGSEPLARGLARYRRRHARGVRGHAGMINGYATGRRLDPGERLLFSAAAMDERVAGIFEAFGARNIGPTRMLATGVPLALAAHARARMRPGRGSARAELASGT